MYIMLHMRWTSVREASILLPSSAEAHIRGVARVQLQCDDSTAIAVRVVQVNAWLAVDPGADAAADGFNFVAVPVALLEVRADRLARADHRSEIRTIVDVDRCGHRDDVERAVPELRLEPIWRLEVLGSAQ